MKSDLLKAAHAEARNIVAQKGYSYAEAFKFGLRRAHSAVQKQAFVAAVLAQPAAPKFMFLRGL
jgi:hypothetical protein